MIFKNKFCAIVVTYIVSSNLSAQIFDFSKKKDFENVSNSELISELTFYLDKHPKDKKYAPIIKERINCLQRRNEFNSVKISNDTNEIIVYIEKYYNVPFNCKDQNLKMELHDIDTLLSLRNFLITKSEWKKIKFKELDCSLEKDTTCLKNRLKEIRDFSIHYSTINYPVHSEIIIEIDKLMDNLVWLRAFENYSKISLSAYLKDSSFQVKKHILECQSLLEELNVWEKCLDLNKHNKYVEFKELYPDSKYVKDGTLDNQLKKIEQKRWNQALKNPTIRKYDQFIVDFPHGYYSEEAVKKVEKLMSNHKISSDPIFDSPYETYGLDLFRDKESSKLKIHNGADVVAKAQLSGPERHLFIIQPGKTKTFNVKNGVYSIIVSAPYDVNITPLKGKQELIGYQDYELNLIIQRYTVPSVNF